MEVLINTYICLFLCSNCSIFNTASAVLFICWKQINKTADAVIPSVFIQTSMFPYGFISN